MHGRNAGKGTQKIAMKNLKSLLLGLTALVLLQAGSASAAIISYRLSDKAFGAENPPDYGLRLDDLFTNPTDSNWTFSFDKFGASMLMDIDTLAESVRIHGTVFGGRDVGAVWDAATTAFWELDFTYNLAGNLGITDLTDGYWSVPNTGDSAGNFGWMKLLDDKDLDGITGSDKNKFLALGDYHGGSFVANGGPNPAGPYVSAWLQSTDGFVTSLAADPSTENYARPNGGACCMDFGFRAERVPEPGTIAILGLGLVAIGLGRRKQVNQR